jgi:hypothetical protein
LWYPPACTVNWSDPVPQINANNLHVKSWSLECHPIQIASDICVCTPKFTNELLVNIICTSSQSISGAVLCYVHLCALQWVRPTDVGHSQMQDHAWLLPHSRPYIFGNPSTLGPYPTQNCLQVEKSKD